VGGSYTLRGNAGADGLTLLHELMERVGSDHPGIEPLDLSMMETAVIEVAGNVVEHGTPPGALHYEFRLEVTKDHLRALFLDTGDPVPTPADGSVHDDLAESGRGLWIARGALDELRYERRGATNAWIMTRSRTASQSPGRPGG
jgi:serine/threonine-protein kinase RsbW